MQTQTITQEITSIFEMQDNTLPPTPSYRRQKDIDKLVDIVNNKYKTIGWKVDLQEDFMNDGSRNNYVGKLAITNAMNIAKTVKKVEQTLRMYSIPILGSMDWHNEDSEEFPAQGTDADFKKTFPLHCVAETYGAQFIDEAKPHNPMYVEWNKDYDLGTLTANILTHEGEIIFRKDSVNVFGKNGNKYASPVIQQINTKNAIVYGVALEVCDDFAIKGLLDSGVNVYAVTDAMKAINEKIRDAVLDSWKDLGVKLLTSDQLYSVLPTIKKYD
ncbi:MAG: cysteine hydrolase family protein [Candidatus Nanoarchaeia archaeon]